MKIVYAADKPGDCRYCYYWQPERRKCRMGEENCYYLLRPERRKANPCDGCPYGKINPCVGFCMQKIMKEGRKNG